MLDCGNGIAFDEESHSYTLDGKAVPGVTKPLELLYDFRFVKEEDLERARDLGKKVHKTIELFEAGTLKRDSLHKTLNNHLLQWEKFKEDFGYIPAGFETFVASRRWGYCGCMDSHGILLPQGELPEFELLLDVKTGEDYLPHELQTEGYKIAAVEMGIMSEQAKRASLYLDESGYALRWHNHPLDRAAFLSTLTIYHRVQHHGKSR